MPQLNQQVELRLGQTRRDGFERAWNEYWTVYLSNNKIDNELIGIHLHLKNLSFSGRSPNVVLGLRQLAKILKVSPNTLQLKLAALVEVGLIERSLALQNNNKITQITVNDPVATLDELETIIKKIKDQKGGVSEIDTPLTVSETDTPPCQKLIHPVLETDTPSCQKLTQVEGLKPLISMNSGLFRHVQTCSDMTDKAAASRNGAAAAAFNDGFRADLKAKLLALGLGEQNAESLLEGACDETKITRLQQAVELMELRQTERPIVKTQSYFRKLLASKTLAADLEQARLDHHTHTHSELIQAESPEEQQRKFEYEFRARIEAAFDNLPVPQQEAFKNRFLASEGHLGAPGWKNWSAEAQAEWIRHQTIKLYWSEFYSDCSDAVGSF